MKAVVSTLAVIIAAPAFAHPGPHLHPHGSEGWIALAALAVIAVLAYWAYQRR